MRGEDASRIAALERIIWMLAEGSCQIATMEVDEAGLFDAERRVCLHHLGACCGLGWLTTGWIGIEAQYLEPDRDFEITELSIKSKYNAGCSRGGIGNKERQVGRE